jgi:hypothetical protein
MTIARAHLVDPAVSRWYHCITRCVRRAFLLGEGTTDRKVWIESRLEELAEIFAVSVGGFSVMDNHLHVLVRLDPDVAREWSDEAVVRRWGRLFPPRDKARQPLAVSDEWVRGHLLNLAWLTRARQRLQSLSWFMKCLKEPLARLAKHQDQARGAFFEGRFRRPMALPDRGPSSDRLAARGDRGRILPGELPAAGRLHSAAVPGGKSDAVGRRGRDSRASGHQCRSLASAAR